MKSWRPFKSFLGLFKDCNMLKLPLTNSEMAGSSVTERLKNKLTVDDEDNERETDSGKDLDLPVDKLSLGPKKKLIVLCLGGLLVDRVHVKFKTPARLRRFRPDVECGNFKVFKRPFCTEFLNFCFQRFEVGIWSAAQEHNMGEILTNITGGNESKFLLVWGQEECIDTGFRCVDNASKPLFLKKIEHLWEEECCKGKYSASNTLLIDDEPHTSLLNPPNTAIFPHPYKRHNPKDTFLGPNGELQKYLYGLADANDVPSYVKDHPIGQPAITPSDSDWDEYSEVILADKEDGYERCTIFDESYTDYSD